MGNRPKTSEPVRQALTLEPRKTNHGVIAYRLRADMRKTDLSISRRAFSAGALALCTARAQQGPLTATIKMNTERAAGDIDPKVYGNFIEHLGRSIYGGIFEEGSTLSDSNGFRRDVLEGVRKLNVPLLRWPGGNFSSNYHWRDGIGPRSERPPRLEMAWGTVESNRFGTHEFLNYAETLRTEPY